MLFDCRKLETNLMSTERRMGRLWYTHTEECYTAVRMKGLQMHKKDNVEGIEQNSGNSI